MLDLLFLMTIAIDLTDSDVSEEKDGGDASYLIDCPLDVSELFSLSEVVSETPVVEIASAPLQFIKHCHYGFSRVG